MAEPRALHNAVLLHISRQTSIPLKSLVSTIALLDEGATVPFIARYRKEATGNLDEVQIRVAQEKLEYFRELEERRATVLQTIAGQGKLTPELRASIEAALEKNELEDLYLPFKPKRRTKASVAREKGLEPLAQFLWDQQPGTMRLRDYARTFGGSNWPRSAAVSRPRAFRSGYPRAVSRRHPRSKPGSGVGGTTPGAAAWQRVLKPRGNRSRTGGASVARTECLQMITEPRL
jgi:transcription accessory factor Tex-like protein